MQDVTKMYLHIFAFDSWTEGLTVLATRIILKPNPSSYCPTQTQDFHPFLTEGQYGVILCQGNNLTCFRPSCDLTSLDANHRRQLCQGNSFTCAMRPHAPCLCPAPRHTSLVFVWIHFTLVTAACKQIHINKALPTLHLYSTLLHIPTASTELKHHSTFNLNKLLSHTSIMSDSNSSTLKSYGNFPASKAFHSR